MGLFVLIIFYGSILFCVIASILKMVKYVSFPLHLHWELYRGPAIYGTLEWWHQPHTGLGEKLKSIASDIFLLKGYYQRDKGLWFFLYLFHLGIYLLILWHAWLFLFSVLSDIEKASSFGRIWGHLSTGLAFIGGTGILIKRITNEDSRPYYPPVHYVKWVLMLITLIGAFYAVDFYFGGRMPDLFKYVRDQVTFQDFERKLHPAVSTASHVLFASIWLIYFPFSHILKLFFRYYHLLRWDGVLNIRGGEIETRVQALLNLTVTWSAPHIRPHRKWKEIAADTGIEARNGT